MSSKSSHIPMPAGFLSLAPTTSTGYPLSQKPRATSSTSTTSTTSDASLPLTTTALQQVPSTTPVAEAPKARTESLSSDGSKSGLRYLKLDPVHQGAHLDGKGDWHDVAVDE
ncbi:hypothetical protein GE09DRAFT_1219238 [Coniochaeta sp. 2T2.1]|nr:hypothetical protein GE09DRAFT_1219238 [Coniochaeta sp. 2T2.1]